MIKKLLLIFLFLIPLVSAEYIAPYPDELDYRDFQGQNWMTSVKNQEECGSCWAFATNAVLESYINLYYNQLVNEDLSEQELVSDCCTDCGSCSGGLPSNALLYYIETNGVVTESCFPYEAQNSACNLCPNHDDVTWIFNSEERIFQEQQYIKTFLVTNGPLPMIIDTWNHAVALSGYEKNDSEDIWIFKNSWGEDWGEDGYGYISEPINFPHNIYFRDYVSEIVNSPNPNNINCLDGDGDDYCYWGITESMPGSCPGICLSYKDEDDSNPNIYKEMDLWISDYDVPEKTKIDEMKHYRIYVNYKGNNENQVINNVEVNLYVDGSLLQGEVIPSLNDGETYLVDFILDPNGFYEPYFNNKFRWEIVPKTGEINTENNYLENDVWVYNYDNGFIISESGYVFDCYSNNNPEGHQIEAIVGPKGGEGISSSYTNSIEIKNCLMGGWYKDIYLDHVENSLVQNNRLGDGSGLGIWLYHSNYNNLTQNSPIQDSNGQGIFLEYSNHNEISDNIIQYTDYDCVGLDNSDNNHILHNLIKNCYYDGLYLFNSSANLIEGNAVHENRRKGIALTFGEENTLFDNNGYNNLNFFILLYGSENNHILNNWNQGMYGGLAIYSSNDYGYTFPSRYNEISDNIMCQFRDYEEGYYLDFSCQEADTFGNYGDHNKFGYYLPPYDPYAVWECEDGWPEHEINYYACNQCSDGTLEEECSENMPKYCLNRNLINNCQECGCPVGYSCKSDGSCQRKQGTKYRPMQAV